MFTPETWDLVFIMNKMVTVYTDKPVDYVTCEKTSFVEKHIKLISFIRISTKKTICLLTMKNGFEIIGYSSCINSDHYRHDIASKYALKMAVDKASEIIAYGEQSKLLEAPGTETYDTPE